MADENTENTGTEGAGSGNPPADTGTQDGSQSSGSDGTPPADSGNQDGGDTGAGTEDSGNSIDSLPEWAQTEIRGLRKESARHRNDNKSLSERLGHIEGGLKKMVGGEDTEDTPEQQMQSLSDTNEGLSFTNAVLALSIEHGVPQDNVEYFSFLMEKTLESLEDDQELSEEEVLAVIQKVKGQGRAAGNSSVDDGKAPSPGGTSDVTLEQFSAMTVLEKSELYRKKPDVYKKLFAQAKQKKMIK